MEVANDTAAPPSLVCWCSLAAAVRPSLLPSSFILPAGLSGTNHPNSQIEGFAAGRCGFSVLREGREEKQRMKIDSG